MPGLSLSSLLSAILKLVNGGLFSAASVAPSPVSPTIPSPTQTTSQLVLKIERTSTTIDGCFGRIWIQGALVCESGENLGKEIAEGLYTAVIDKSPRLGYECPHIRVPARDEAAGGDAGIRIHIANHPCEVEGCIFTGLQKDGDAEDFSKQAFDKLMALLPAPGVPFSVIVYSQH